jgi:ATP diphosphatase
MKTRRPIDRLLAIMARLRNPAKGCPWDREQNFATIAPYTIEEAYEVADAIERNDMAALKDELGDLLFQVVFHARMAEELGLFGFDECRRGDRRQDGADAIRTCSATSRSVRSRRRMRLGRRTRRPSGTQAAAPRASSTGWRSPSRRCCAPPRSRAVPPASASTGPMPAR